MIIHRRSLLAGALGLLGLTLLYGGWRAAPVPVQPAATKVQAPASVPATAASGEARAGTEAEDFFAEYRLERERMRSRQVELLEGLADSSRSGEETRRKAQEQLLEISRAMAREVEVEQLLRAKGFADAVVSLRGDAATVVVKAPHVTGEEAVRISDLVGRGAGIPARNVFIIPRE
ncbi:MAG: SpoIIIAH-like family protein [Desulfotomaculales bacterium]